MSITLSNLDSSNASTVPQIEIGAAVRRSREAAGYTIDDLSETCGLTGNEISRIEIGADTDPTKLRRIAAALKVEPSAFLTH
jgi:transcriptional regulator with XRE-family HTH domain